MKLTTKLGLKKPDLTDYVNIGDLNDNMDVLDGEVGSLKEGTTEVTDLETVDKTYKGAINEINTSLSSHKAESATQAHLAKNIGLEDLDDNFTAVNVEGAMSELFINVSNGKGLVGGAITDIDDSVVIPTDPTFSDLASSIGQISTGKKWSKGKLLSVTKPITFVASNLGFKPSTIVMYGNREKHWVLCVNSNGGFGQVSYHTGSAGSSFLPTQVIITNDGFNLTTAIYSEGSLSHDLWWEAYE